MAEDYNEFDLRQEKTKKETDASCPSCAANVRFRPETGKLHCDYCGWEGEIEIAEEESVEELDFFEAEHRGNFEWGAEKKSINCQSCGAHAVYDALQVSGVCPFCGSSQVTEESSANSLAPNGVIPFEISAEKADALFVKWVKKSFFAPSDLKKNVKAHHFIGIYIPHWTFDANASAQYTAKAGKTYSTGKTTYTRWSNVSGNFGNFFDDILVNASERHNSKALQQIEPYNFSKAMPYKPQYLSGFISERYSVGIQDGFNRCKVIIRDRLNRLITSEIKRRHGADMVRELRFDIVLRNVTYKYVLLPLWVSYFTYKGKRYEFKVNGQTGKLGGKIPTSGGKVALVVGGILLLVGGGGALVAVSNGDISYEYYAYKTEAHQQVQNYMENPRSAELPGGATLHF